MLKRILFRNYRLLSSIRYWAGRRFTKAGFLALGGLVMTAGLALDTDQSVAYQAFALVFCLLLVAFGYAPFFRARFTVRRTLPRFGSVGEPLPYSLIIENRTTKVQHGLIALEDLADPRPTSLEFSGTGKTAGRNLLFRLHKSPQKIQARLFKEALLPPLAPHGEAEIPVELTPLKRGVLRFAGVTVAASDPFGLFRAFVKVPLAKSIVILPKRYPLKPIALPGTLKYQQGGVAMASSVGQSEEFVSLRDYRRGDPLRHIHWKSWAKTGRPIVKEFQDEFFVRHGLILDTFTEPETGELFEEAVSIAASFACTIKTQESLLDLMFVGPQAFCFTSGRGLAHTEQMLEILSAVSICREQPFDSLRNLVIEHAPALNGCICIFLKWDKPRQELVKLLKAMELPVLVLVVTPAGHTDPLDPGPMRDEPESLHALEAGKIAEGLEKL